MLLCMGTHGCWMLCLCASAERLQSSRVHAAASRQGLCANCAVSCRARHSPPLSGAQHINQLFGVVKDKKSKDSEAKREALKYARCVHTRRLGSMLGALAVLSVCCAVCVACAGTRFWRPAARARAAAAASAPLRLRRAQPERRSSPSCRQPALPASALPLPLREEQEEAWPRCRNTRRPQGRALIRLLLRRPRDRRVRTASQAAGRRARRYLNCPSWQRYQATAARSTLARHGSLFCFLLLYLLLLSPVLFDGSRCI